MTSLDPLNPAEVGPPATLTQSIDRRAIVLWRISGLLRAVWNTLLALGGAALLVQFADVPWRWAWIGVALFAAVHLLAYVVVIPPLRWRLYRYEVGDQELDIQRGLWVVRRTLVPLVRVQHVDTRQGLLAKLFGLSTVSVTTAATTHEIPALTDAVADGLRARITALARMAREAQ